MKTHNKIYAYCVFLIIIIITSSCKSKQITTEKVITKIDTIFKEKIKEIQVPIQSTIEIEKPCDSSGILKAFKQTIKTKTVYVTVESKNGNIVASVNLDSIKQEAVKDYISKNSSEKETVVEIRFKTPVWKNKLLIVMAILMIVSYGWIFGNKFLKAKFPLLSRLKF